MNLRRRSTSAHSVRSQNDENAAPIEAKKTVLDVDKPTEASHSSLNRPLRKRKNEVLDPPPDPKDVPEEPPVKEIASKIQYTCTTEHNSEVKVVGTAPSARRRKRIKLEDASLENHFKLFASSHILFIGFPEDVK